MFYPLKSLGEWRNGPFVKHLLQDEVVLYETRASAHSREATAV